MAERKETASMENRKENRRKMAKLKLKAHHINQEWCKGCGICVAFCPKQVLELDREDKAVAVRLENCIVCRMCELRCPDLAIEVKVEAFIPDDGRGTKDKAL